MSINSGRGPNAMYVQIGGVTDQEVLLLLLLLPPYIVATINMLIILPL